MPKHPSCGIFGAEYESTSPRPAVVLLPVGPDEVQCNSLIRDIVAETSVSLISSISFSCDQTSWISMALILSPPLLIQNTRIE